MGEVDLAFIQDIEHRPKFITGLEAGGIPLIDLSLLTSHQSLEGCSKDFPQAISDLVQEIGIACKDEGFFKVINHGVLYFNPREMHQALQILITNPIS